MINIFARDENGVWKAMEPYPSSWNSVYGDSLLRYLNCLDTVFQKAQEKCEFEFLLTLFRVRGLQDAGWEPFETSRKTIHGIYKLKDVIEDQNVILSIQLWRYGHIVEASEPYEILYNLIDITKGGRFLIQRFPFKKSGAPQSPGDKINKIEQVTRFTELEKVVVPLKEIWNRNLRNAVFHSDYSIFDNKVRIISPIMEFSFDEIVSLVNKALAYFECFDSLYKSYIKGYDKPKVINVHPGFSSVPDEKAVVIVREGYGAIGMKDNWTKKQLLAGKIPHRIGRFFPDEIKLLDKDPTLCILPKREKKDK